MNTPFEKISNLIIHPLAEKMPLPAKDDPARCAIIASICDIGVLEPIKICKGRVVDGRIRLHGATAAGLVVVPVQEVEEKDVNSIILQTLLARRHYTKSALAYLSVPILEEALVEIRKRHLENLKINAKLPGARLPLGDTAEEIAESLGVSRRLVFMAKEIHKRFARGPKAIRETWEPKILSGELGLAEVQQAISGKLAAIDGRTHPKNDPCQLVFALWDTAAARLSRWDQIPEDELPKARADFREKVLANLPEELWKEIRAFERERREKRLAA